VRPLEVRPHATSFSSIIPHKLRSSPTPRPVQVPIGQLSRLCIALFSCDATEQVNEPQSFTYLLLTTVTERRLRGLFVDRYENIHPSDCLGTCRRFDRVFVDTVSRSTTSLEFASSRTSTRYFAYLLPNLSQILSCVAHHLERKRSPYVSVRPYAGRTD